MNEAEIKDISMRIAEYNLRANAYFKKSIRELNIQERKTLEIEREQLTTYVHSKFPQLKIYKYMRQLRKYDEEGNLIPDMPNDIDMLAKLLKDGSSEQKEKNVLQEV